MNKLYPIKFIADPRLRVWGGDYLHKKLHKEFDKELLEQKIGESWEIWSLYGQSSVASNGFLAGNTLDEIIEIYLQDLLGENTFNYFKGDFPVMVKILDIKNRISVQVHPNDQIAFEREDSYGKAEFWYVMETNPDSKIYMGFKRDITPTEFYQRCKEGTLEEVLNVFTPKKGDCIYIEPGCIHSASNIVIAEILQSADITYRLYDWGREKDPATARQMHIEDAIDVIDYKKYNKEKYYFEQVNSNTTIINSSHFVIKGVDLTDSIRVVPSLTGSFIIYFCTRGEAQIKLNNKETYSIKEGETILIPASMEDFLLEPVKGNPHLLEVFMPQIEEEDAYLNYHDHDHDHDHEHEHDHGHCHCHDHNCNCGE